MVCQVIMIPGFVEKCGIIGLLACGYRIAAIMYPSQG